MADGWSVLLVIFLGINVIDFCLKEDKTCIINLVFIIIGIFLLLNRDLWLWR